MGWYQHGCAAVKPNFPPKTRRCSRVTAPGALLARKRPRGAQLLASGGHMFPLRPPCGFKHLSAEVHFPVGRTCGFSGGVNFEGPHGPGLFFSSPQPLAPSNRIFPSHAGLPGRGGAARRAGRAELRGVGTEVGGEAAGPAPGERSPLSFPFSWWPAG